MMTATGTKTPSRSSARPIRSATRSTSVLASSPKLKTASGEEAGIVLTTADGRSFELSIAPHSHPAKLPKRLRELR